nr:helicase-related protein [Micromonospora sp. DSM 115978]
DVGGVTHVVNYQCPEDEKVYLHRIGRTGRAGESGVALTFVDWDDLPRWTLVNRALALPFEEPVETYSTSPHLFTALDIPADAKGTLPVASRTRAGLSAEKIEDLGETGRGRNGRGRTKERGGERAGGQRARTSGSAASADDSALGTADPSVAEAPPGAPRVRRRTRGGRNAEGDAVKGDPRVVEFSAATGTNHATVSGSTAGTPATEPFGGLPADRLVAEATTATAETATTADAASAEAGAGAGALLSDGDETGAVFEAAAASDGARRRRRRRGGRGRSGAGARGADSGDQLDAEHDEAPQAESA